jgi:LPPG:FO 2-phospho-L-lactate transferase
VGAAKFLRGLIRCIDPRQLRVIVNTGDDDEFYGLHISPDLDTVTYTLAEVVNPQTGWGLAGESFHTLEALARFYGKGWFALGDRDFATHLFRTERLRRGSRLSQVTAEIARRFGVRCRILPMSDDPVRTFVSVRGRGALPFQQYFVRNRFRGQVERIQWRGIRQARVLPAALAAVRAANTIIVAPSNPFVSIGPILAFAPMREALARVRKRVVAISPIVGGKAIKGPADKMMRGLGHESSVLGIARLYQDCVGTLVIDNADRRYLEPIRALGMEALATDTIMSSPERAAELASVVLRAAKV